MRTDQGQRAVANYLEMLESCQVAAYALAGEIDASKTTPEYVDAMNAVKIAVDGEYGDMKPNDVNNPIKVAKGQRSGTPVTALMGESFMVLKKMWADDETPRVYPPTEMALHDFLIATAGPYRAFQGDWGRLEAGEATHGEVLEGIGFDAAKGLDGYVEFLQPEMEAMGSRLLEAGRVHLQAAMFYRFLLDEWAEDEAETRGRIRRILEWREKRIEARVNPSRRDKKR